MSWLGVVTDAGKAIYNQFSLSGTTLNITSLKLGTGTVANVAAMRALTDLVSEKDEGVIESKQVISTGTQFRLRANAADSEVGAYTLKEMGMIATVDQNGNQTEVLFAYFMNTDGIGIPSESTFPDFMYMLSATLILDNTTELSFEIPPSSYVSYLQFSAEQARINGLLNGKKSTQTPVVDPTASGNALSFIDTISQNSNGEITVTKKTVTNMVGASQSAAGTAGLVPAPAAGKNESFLRGDGVWANAPETIYSGGTGINVSGKVIGLANSGATAGSYGPTANVTGSNNQTVKIPQITIDATGRVTSIVERTLTCQDTNTTYSAATQSAAGLMSAADKKKLDGIASGATANVGTITGIKMNNVSKGSSGVVDLGTVLTSHQSLASCLKTTGDQSASGIQSFTNTTESSSTSTGAVKISGGLGVAKKIYGNQVWGAVWNDYAECREADTMEPGRCVTETESGVMTKTKQRLEPACRIISDTYGFCIGKTDKAQTPIGVSGRVLAYHTPGHLLKVGDAVCSGPDGTVDRMTREEIMIYPDRIVGIVSEIPKYKYWNAGSEQDQKMIKVDGRIWIYVR